LLRMSCLPASILGMYGASLKPFVCGMGISIPILIDYIGSSIRNSQYQHLTTDIPIYILVVGYSEINDHSQVILC